MTDNGLIFKISKQLVQLNNKQITQFKKIRRSKYTSFQRRHTYGQQLHEKMLNITNHQRNANQTHSDISPHTSKNGYYQKDRKLQGCEKRNPCARLVGM